MINTVTNRPNNVADKITRFLEIFKDEGVEIVSKEDFNDLKLIKATRHEDSVPFEEYLQNAN